jgi:acetoacetate decarboxylase
LNISHKTHSSDKQKMSAIANPRSVEVTAVVDIQIAGFTARETFGDYAEKNVVMRVSHQGFMTSTLLDMMTSSAHPTRRT